LAHYAIHALTEAGIRPGHHRILDPASGGAAFLVPLAARISEQSRRRGARGETILRTIESSIAGVEIDPGLATLSRLLIADLLRDEIARTGRKPQISIERADTLQLQPPDILYDAVIGNPPYGRIFRPSKAVLEGFSPVISDGYVNLYALFLEQVIRWVKPGGVICLIVPMSFVGGPYFTALRRRILETSHVLQLDPIDKRSDLFLDVLYDVCVLVLRKKGVGVRASVPKSSLLVMGEPPRPLGTLEITSHPSGHIWAIPDETNKEEVFRPGLETLADYGYITKTGYFVWNREQHRYRVGKKPRSDEVPLFWAHNVRANSVCKPSAGKTHSGGIGFVRIDQQNSARIRSDAIVLQRTTNRRQNRRLIGAIIRRNKVPGGRGFVTENHTILILPDPAKKQEITMKMLCRLLNTEAVDTRFRRISGSVSVSTKALRHLPLPAAVHVQSESKSGTDYNQAAEVAYARSAYARPRRLAVAAGG
jgi:adenine-specific DNA-methyltransferase